MVIFFLILALFVAGIAIIFALQNTDPITITFLAWELQDPQPAALVLLLALAAGVLIGIFFMAPGSMRSRWRLSNKRKQIIALEKSLQEAKIKQELAESKVAELNQTALSPEPFPKPPEVDFKPPLTDQSPLLK